MTRSSGFWGFGEEGLGGGEEWFFWCRGGGVFFGREEGGEEGGERVWGVSVLTVFSECFRERVVWGLFGFVFVLFFG